MWQAHRLQVISGLLVTKALSKLSLRRRQQHGSGGSSISGSSRRASSS
jgi:hypothetical protein